jgi:excisionase family DNA binding protein
MSKRNITFLSELQALLADRTKTIKDLIDYINNCPNSYKLLLTPAEAAEILGLSRSQVYNLLHQGKLDGFKIKKLYWRITFQYIENYLQKHRLPGKISKKNPLTFLNGGCI